MGLVSWSKRRCPAWSWFTKPNSIAICVRVRAIEAEREDEGISRRNSRSTIDRREKPERVWIRWMKMSVSCMKSEMAETTSSAGRAKPHLNQSMTNVDTTNEKCASSECAQIKNWNYFINSSHVFATGAFWAAMFCIQSVFVVRFQCTREWWQSEISRN